MDPSQIINQILAAAGISAAQLPANVDYSLPNILRAIVILIVIYIVARIVRSLLRRALRGLQFNPRVETVLLQIAFYGIIGLGVVWVLGGFGLSVVLLGAAAAFALKDLIENFAAGLLIMATRPFQPGDWIMIGDKEGRVVEVGWRGTFLDTFDGRRVIVPNANVVTDVVTNNSLASQLRSALRLNVAAQSDFARVEELILNALAPIQGISANPPPIVLIENMTGNALNLRVSFWVADPVNQQPKVISQAWRAIKETLSANEIDMNPATTITMTMDANAK